MKTIKGNGTTFRYENKWRTEVRYIDESGKERRKVFTAKTIAESRKAADDFINMNFNGTSTHINDTVNKFTEYYIDSIISIDTHESSVIRNKQILRNQISPLIGNIPMEIIRTEDVQGMINTLIKKDYSHSTITKAINLFNSASRYFVGLGGKMHYSAELIKLPKADDREVIYFNEAEIDLMQDYLFSKIKEYRYAAALIILANTGLRVGELLGLSKENIDLKRKEMYIVESASQVSMDHNGNLETKIHNKDPKTKSGKRTVILNSNAIKAIEFILERDKNIDCKYLICSKNATQVYQKQLNDLFHKMLKETSLEKGRSCGVHSLRHSFATKLVNNNISIEAVSYILGHSSDTITKKYYIHDKERRAMNEISSSSLFN